MSVSMMIENLDTGELEEVPVAAQSTYKKIWVKGGMEIGLQMIPAFDGPLGCGVTITQDNMHALFSELDRLSAWITAQHDPPYRLEFLERHIGFYKRLAVDQWKAYQRELPRRAAVIRQKIESLDFGEGKYEVSIG